MSLAGYNGIINASPGMSESPVGKEGSRRQGRRPKARASTACEETNENPVGRFIRIPARCLAEILPQQSPTRLRIPYSRKSLHEDRQRLVEYSPTPPKTRFDWRTTLPLAYGDVTKRPIIRALGEFCT